jgi:XTP/dITP diphosphohydrolase
MDLLVATTNPGKLRELRDLLGSISLNLLTLNDFPSIGEIEETGRTFRENAVLKAVGYARWTGVMTLADDSGLEVVALDGRPGVDSARYAGREAGYDVKIATLLEEIASAGDTARSARFVCSMVIADHSGGVKFSTEGVCPGKIALGPRGANGFGYDPVFIPDGYDKTFGELPEEVKRSISHRAVASRSAVRFLLDFIAV